MEFRTDIQGLRGLAVVSVVAFHAGITQISGGYIGVDIFFVISGYLITGLLRRSVQKGSFSFAGFYSRRARRLLPAAFATIVSSYLVALIVFPPHMLERFSGEAIYASISASNIFFWAESGYFDASAVEKPLLHTWSLGVEEQFYLVWPALLLVLARAQKQWVSVALLLMVGAASFGASIWAMSVDASAAFFLTPFRIYEFVIGGLLVWMPLPKKRSMLLEFLYIGGLCLALYSAFNFSEHTPFPGYYALVPTIGTALMIYAGQYARSSVLVSNTPIRYLGDISYSLYLVHWPITVFWIRYSPQGLQLLDTIGILFLSLISAIILNKTIEDRFRNPNRDSRLSESGFGLVMAIGVTAFITVSATSWAQNGWLWRVDKSIQAANSYSIENAEEYLWKQFTAMKSTNLKNTDNLNVLLVGDSQAADFLNVLTETGLIENLNIRTFQINAVCNVAFVPPGEQDRYWKEQNFRTKRAPGRIKGCKARHETLFSPESESRVDLIIVASLWFEHSVSRLEDTVSKLEETYSAPVLIIGRKQMNGGSLGILNKWGSTQGVEEFAASSRHLDTDVINGKIESTPGILFFNPMDYICPSERACLVLTDEGVPVMFDQSHFSQEGARQIGGTMKSTLVEILHEAALKSETMKQKS